MFDKIFSYLYGGDFRYVNEIYKALEQLSPQTVKRKNALNTFLKRLLPYKRYCKVEDELNKIFGETAENAYKLGFARGIAFVVDSIGK